MGVLYLFYVSEINIFIHIANKRREAEYVGKRVMVMELPEKRRRGRPKRRWLDNVRNNVSERELSGEEAQDRVN